MTEVTMQAGWYNDPRDPNTLRWWDGQAWTPNTRPAATNTGPTPPNVSPPSPPAAPPVPPSPPRVVHAANAWGVTPEALAANLRAAQPATEPVEEPVTAPNHPVAPTFDFTRPAQVAQRQLATQRPVRNVSAVELLVGVGPRALVSSFLIGVVWLLVTLGLGAMIANSVTRPGATIADAIAGLTVWYMITIAWGTVCAAVSITAIAVMISHCMSGTEPQIKAAIGCALRQAWLFIVAVGEFVAAEFAIGATLGALSPVDPIIGIAGLVVLAVFGVIALVLFAVGVVRAVHEAAGTS